jgi:serine/threonine-protein kinase
MQFTFACPKCSSRLEADSELSGTFSECPGCKASLHVPDPRISPGTTIGGFRLERLLGRGGMGDVFMATQLSMDRQVAVKILPAALTSNPAFVERFLVEVRTAAKLEHPNIVTAFDAGEDCGTYYLAMGYVEGETLEETLRRDGPLPEPTVLQMGAKLARALGFAWEEFGMLHRDIKPANIMLDRFGEVKLMDLGVAKMVGEETGLTITGVALGTPSYMSPEQIRGAADVDCRSDIYSLGCCMFHLLTGHPPYAGRNPLEVMNLHATAPIPAIRGDRPGVSAGCEALILSAMQKVPEARPPSWPEMAARIKAALAGQAMPTSRRRGLGPWLAGTLTVLVLAMLAEGVAAWVLWNRQRSPAPARPPGPRPAPAASAAAPTVATPPPAASSVNLAMDRIAELMIDRKFADANEFWLIEKSRLAALVGAERVAALDAVVTSAIRIPARIMDTFKAEIGQEITVSLRDRRLTLLVTAVEEFQVLGTTTRGEAVESVSFSVRELDLEEELRRLRVDSDPNPDLTRGIVSLGFGRAALSVASLRRAGHPLGDALLVAVESRRLTTTEALPRPVNRLRDLLPGRRPVQSPGKGKD